MSNLLISPSAFNATMLGIYGTGRVLPIGASTTWTIPAGITTVRVRVWGSGANGNGGDYGVDGGSGGGFAIKTITGLTPGGTVVVTVGQGAGASSSFGTHVSATGGTSGAGSAGGVGSLGDINMSGGAAGGSSGNGGGGGGGAGSLFGNGGRGGTGGGGRSGASGGGSGNSTGTLSGGVGGSGLTGSAGPVTAYVIPGNNTPYLYASASDTGNIPSIDFIGTGPGGSAGFSAGGHAGANGGGGGGGGGAGGFPGGGGGGGSGGAAGLVIVEY